MSLKVTTEPKENRQLKMVIEVDQQRVEQELRKAARALSRRLNIPGFRKGKAPYHIILRYVGKEALYEEILDKLGQEVYREALEQSDVEPYDTASLEEIELEPLRYILTIPLEPKVELGDYRSLRIEPPQVEVDEETVQARIEDLLERQAGYHEVDRPAQYGDLLTVDVRAVVLDDEGNETDTVVLDEEDWDLVLDEENPLEPPGFQEALVGMSPGEEKTFDLDWPEDSESMYAGKRVRFHVKLHKVQEYRRPELTDELAQELGYESAAALEEAIREDLRKEAEEEAESEYLDKIMQALDEISTLEYPPAAVERQLDLLLDQTDRSLRQMGLNGLDHYLALVGQDREEYRESRRAEAEESLRRVLLLNAVMEAEGITVSEEEFEQRLAEMYSLPEDASEEDREYLEHILNLLRQGPGRESIEYQIKVDKTIQRLMAIARGEEVPPPGAAPETEAPAQAEESPEPVEPTAQAETSEGGQAESETAQPEATAESE